ncbi:hypothetical protein [Arachidicoccus terrestris]|uniref:hypothetical protein n=1 Tax=Arachidicoccus terrestris TaxID=2875539 RepID=UPI001CC3ECBE|nr:hypothetical protein [Arachidicoccus terrestris]UAY56226.1 hypothetical protein K9M52_04200 [Arachidicoccus terrestris]
MGKMGENNLKNKPKWFKVLFYTVFILLGIFIIAAIGGSMMTPDPAPYDVIRYRESNKLMQVYVKIDTSIQDTLQLRETMSHIADSVKDALPDYEREDDQQVKVWLFWDQQSAREEKLLSNTIGSYLTTVGTGVDEYSIVYPQTDLLQKATHKVHYEPAPYGIARLDFSDNQQKDIYAYVAPSVRDTNVLKVTMAHIADSVKRNMLNEDYATMKELVVWLFFDRKSAKNKDLKINTVAGYRRVMETGEDAFDFQLNWYDQMGTKNGND